VKKLGLSLFVCLFLSSVVMAQSGSPDAPQPSGHHKLFSFSPQLSAANDSRPMSASEKFEYFAIDTVNPFQLLASAASAGIDQADDRYPSWGQGGEGFGKRFAANYADAATTNFFATFLFPTVLRQDPRYFRKGEGTFGSRLGYAITRILVTRTDSGRLAPNASLLLGATASGALSNVYYPRDQQTGVNTAERIGITLGTSAGINVAKEFWPDVSHKLFHRE
jgi:hypothetical protein